MVDLHWRLHLWSLVLCLLRVVYVLVEVSDLVQSACFGCRWEIETAYVCKSLIYVVLGGMANCNIHQTTIDWLPVLLLITLIQNWSIFYFVQSRLLKWTEFTSLNFWDSSTNWDSLQILWLSKVRHTIDLLVKTRDISRWLVFALIE